MQQTSISSFLCFAAAFYLCLPNALAESTESDASSKMLANGKKIYVESCADCHGETGEGVEDLYGKSLVGDASVVELARLIHRTMPEDDAESCVDDDAKAVANYIFESFYGPKAQLAKNPPRQRLARLTERQLRQSLADLYIRFADANYVKDERGIKARYRNRSKKDDGEASFDRVDNEINFEFGEDGPGHGIKADNFEVSWTGSIRPDQTGNYEFIINSGTSFVFYFGGAKREFINNYVQSGDKTEFRKSIRLAAGQLYPISLELTHRRRKGDTPPADIKLSWKTPRGVEQVIPKRSFINVFTQPTFIMQTNLPPDDRSYGYERGIAVDQQWNEATTACAIEFANQVTTELWPTFLKRRRKKPNDNREVVTEFLTGMLETAFRRPLNDELKHRYLEQHLYAVDDDAMAIKRVLLLALKSPRFLYPTLDDDHPEPYRVANRLALTLYDSLPVRKELRNAAKGDRLQSEAQIRDLCWGLIKDWRVRAKTQDFLHGWLHWDHVNNVTKSDRRHPKFDDELVQDLEASLHQYMEDVVWSEPSDMRELILGDWSYTSERIADFYGSDWNLPTNDESPTDEESPTKVRFAKTSAADTRLGVLTHPLMMSGLAYDEASSPIHRGVFLLRYALGRTLSPPSEAFTPFSPDLHPKLTTRERTALQTGERSCQVCHSKINSLGFALENFDAVGRYRTKELGRAIDATGRYTTTTGEDREFAGPKELAEFLANNDDSHRAFVRRAFLYFVKQPPAAYGLDVEDRLLETFKRTDFNIRRLIIEIAVVASRPEENN